MPKLVCRICGEEDGFAVEVEVSIKRKRRAWYLVCCQNCWRVMEAMLDRGASRVQQGIDFDPLNSRGNTWWFA